MCTPITAIPANKSAGLAMACLLEAAETFTTTIPPGPADLVADLDLCFLRARAGARSLGRNHEHTAALRDTPSAWGYSALLGSVHDGGKARASYRIMKAEGLEVCDRSHNDVWSGCYGES